MSIRLHFIVEGQTEETFVNRVLIPHLANYSIYGRVRSVETSRKNGIKYRGGGFNSDYKIARKDIVRWMREDQNSNAYFTTMFDFYGLPENFPGYVEARELTDPYARIKKLEGAMAMDIGESRFISYLQLHEFEALLLADAGKLDWMGFNPDKIQNLIRMASKKSSPELIDDGKETAPSKRIMDEIPEYEAMKASVGPVTVEKIGLNMLRNKCPHFKDWLARLESIK